MLAGAEDHLAFFSFPGVFQTEGKNSTWGQCPQVLAGTARKVAKSTCLCSYTRGGGFWGEVPSEETHTPPKGFRASKPFLGALWALNIKRQTAVYCDVLLSFGQRHLQTLAPSAEMCWGFLLYKLGRISGGFFWALFPQNEEKKSGGKIREKIRRPKNKNPRKIRSAKNRL